MNTDEVKSLLRGPVAPVLTVYDEDGEVDLDAIQSNVDQQIRRGLVAGKGTLLAAGAGGDFPLLTTDERKAIIGAICEAARGRAVVIGCAQSPSTREAITLAQYAQSAGCHAVQLSPPWYYAPLPQQVYEFFRAVATNIDIPIMVYHTPWLGCTMEVDLIERLAGDFPNIRALKWVGVNEFQHVDAYIRLAPHMAIIDNAWQPVQSFLLGATGYVSHLANVWPEHEVHFWEMLEQGDLAGALREYTSVYWQWVTLRVWAGQHISSGESFLVKRAAELTGFIGGPDRGPMRTLTEEERRHVREVLQRMGAPLIN